MASIKFDPYTMIVDDGNDCLTWLIENFPDADIDGISIKLYPKWFNESLEFTGVFDMDNECFDTTIDDPEMLNFLMTYGGSTTIWNTTSKMKWKVEFLYSGFSNNIPVATWYWYPTISDMSRTGPWDPPFDMGNSELMATMGKWADTALNTNYFTITKINQDLPIEVYFTTYVNASDGGSLDNLSPLRLEVSTNGEQWMKIDIDEHVVVPELLLNLFVRNSTGTFSREMFINGKTAENYYRLRVNQAYSVSGALSTLIDYTKEEPVLTQPGPFIRLFNEEINLISAEELVLFDYYVPFMYMGMFRACSNLHTAPTMPYASARSFGNTDEEVLHPDIRGNAFWAFAYMFKRCYSLNEITLNFEYVQNNSLRYANSGGMATNQMFSECTGLTKIIWNGKTVPSIQVSDNIHRLSPADNGNDMFIGVTQPG